MALVLFTGVPKTGKTLFAVTKLYAIIQKGTDRHISADIAGLKIEGIEPPPDDWRKLPDGSLVIYDEIQLRDAYKSKRGDSPHDFINELSIHAHRHFDIWIISQHPAKIHSDVLGYVTDHYHTRKALNVNASIYYYWDSAKTSPNGVSARRDYVSKGILRYDKNMFDFYDSTQVDDDSFHDKKINLGTFGKFKIFIFFIFAYFAISPFFKSDDDVLLHVENNQQLEQPQPQVHPEPEPEPESDSNFLYQPTFPQSQASDLNQPIQASESSQVVIVPVYNPVTGDYYQDANKAPYNVAKFNNNCKAFNKSGALLPFITQDECNYYLENPQLLARY